MESESDSDITRKCEKAKAERKAEIKKKQRKEIEILKLEKVWKNKGYKVSRLVSFYTAKYRIINQRIYY